MEVKLSLSQGQKKKLAEAANAGVGCVIQLGGADYGGDTLLKVPARSAAKIEKMAALGKGMRLVLSKSSVMENKKVIGGFLPVLAGLAGAVIPQVLGSLLGGEGIVKHSSEQTCAEVKGKVKHSSERTCAKGLYTHGYIPPPPIVGRGMFMSGQRAPRPSASSERTVLRPAGLPIGAIAEPFSGFQRVQPFSNARSSGEGMFIHGSDGRAGVPKAWGSKTGLAQDQRSVLGSGLKKKRLQKSNETVEQLRH